MDRNLQLINFCSHTDLRWPLQLIKLCKAKNDYSLLNVTDIKLRLEVIVAESH